VAADVSPLILNEIRADSRRLLPATLGGLMPQWLQLISSAAGVELAPQ
jgi:hypothetical protein